MTNEEKFKVRFYIILGFIAGFCLATGIFGLSRLF